MKPTKEEFYNKLNTFIKQNNPTLSFDGEDKVSSILLFKDFMTRLHIWKNELHTEFINFDAINLNLFNDLHINIGEDSDIEETMFYNEYINFLRQNFNLNNLRNKNYLFIYLFIYWELYKDSEEIKKYSYLEHPYESIVKIVARKNMVYKREGVNVSNITMRSFSKPFRLPSLNDNFLDYIDSKCKLVGSDGIPNQERVNELWDEFQILNK